jgi:hypothetical protein
MWELAETLEALVPGLFPISTIRMLGRGRNRGLEFYAGLLRHEVRGRFLL